MNNDKYSVPRDSSRNVDQKRIFSKNTNMNYHIEEKTLNRTNIKHKIITALRKYGLTKTNFNDVENIISLGLEEYLKNLIENLIKISRVRNLNLNLYSKMAEKNQVYTRFLNKALKIHTFNFEKTPKNDNINNFDINPYQDFSIIFTKNMKSLIDNLNNYEELSSSKNQFEKISNFKNKIEQAVDLKDKDKEKTNQTTAVPKVKTRKVVKFIKKARNSVYETI